MGSIKIFLGVLLASLAFVAHVQAQPSKIINVNINSSEYVDVGFPIVRLAAGSPTIAGIKQVGRSPSEILIEGYKAGSTSLLLWYDDRQAPLVYRIIVSPEDPGMAYLIEQAINLPDVHVKMINDRILLTGKVKNQAEKMHAVQVASFYVGGGSGDVKINLSSGVDMSLSTQKSTSSSSGNIEGSSVEESGKILDLLQVVEPTQIRLEALVIDINSDDAKDLGVQWGESGSGGTFSMGEDNQRSSSPVSFKNNPIRWAEQRFGSINATITALVSKGKARILSRPSITTLSGEQATIQIGGKIPYTSYSSLGATNTQFEDYGIILQFKSIVDLEEKITAAVHAEVSNLSGQTVDGQPIIATRRADSFVHLESGSTMIIGGLMDSSESKTVAKIPLLGNIPILGEFFKYTRKSRNKHELVILITPHLVKSDSPARMTEEMRDTYSQAFREEILREEVDLDSPPSDGSFKESSDSDG